MRVTAESFLHQQELRANKVLEFHAERIDQTLLNGNTCYWFYASQRMNFDIGEFNVSTDYIYSDEIADRIIQEYSKHGWDVKLKGCFYPRLLFTPKKNDYLN